jgi:hypothetical protein
MDVVIVPPTANKGLSGSEILHRKWGKQYVDADSENRAIEYMRAMDRKATLAASQNAATRAGALGTVIYAVGHGGVAENHDGHIGYVDFAPMKHFRVTQFEVFYEVKTDWPLTPVREMEQDLAKFTRKNKKHPNKVSKQWCAEYPGTTQCKATVSSLRARARLQEDYDKLCELYHKSPVKLIVPLVCAIGGAREFVDELSSDLGVPVKAFTTEVLAKEQHDGKVRFYLQGNDSTNAEESSTELMPNADADDYYVGNVKT